MIHIPDISLASLGGITVLQIILLGFLLLCITTIISLLLIKLLLWVPPIRHLAQDIMHTLQDWN